MSFLKACRNLAARKLNAEHFDKAKKAAQEKAYSETHNDLVWAKRKGVRINAKARYQKRYAKYLGEANQNKALVDSFISEW